MDDLDDDSSDWSGLDDLGSSTSNLASNILSAAGNLVTAAINQKVQQTTDQTSTGSLTAAPTTNPNAWRTVLLVGVVDAVLVGVVLIVKKA